LIRKRIERYLAYNKSRKLRAIAFNESKATLLLKIIPFLLHANYPDLPGFVDNPECAFGIHLFSPRKMVDPALLRRTFPTSTCLDERTPNPFAENPCIHSVKTIGSIGTIAQTEKSDCDYWLSLDFAGISPEGLELLREKCRKIEAWGAEKGIEIHFFLMDIEQIRENRFDTATDEESAGSALKILLKDELFRTHILVVGKMLLWWLIPPGLSEEEYHSQAKKLKSQPEVNPDRFIDLGYLSDLPRSEIFGACLWQMNKALDSPYKSVIKFAYLELLMQDGRERLPLFSAHIKSLITFPENISRKERARLPLSEIDPYLLLAREIVGFYLNEAEDKKVAALIRECLFLKTLEGMASQKRQPDRKKRLLQTMTLMRTWDLLPKAHQHFSTIHEWNYRELVEFGNRIHSYLVDTYNRLRLIFRQLGHETQVDITGRDLSVLGRKLFTFYEHKTDKISYVKSISREAMAQEKLTFHVAKVNDEDYYYVLQGDQTRTPIDSQTSKVISRNTSLVRLVVWLAINHILTPQSELFLTKTYLPLNLVDIQQLSDAFFNAFPPVIFGHIAPDQLLAPERLEKALVVVNMGKKTVSDKSLASEMVSVNSYGEYFHCEFDSLLKLKNNMQLLLTRHFISRWNHNLSFFIPAQKEQHKIKNLIFNQ